MKDKSERRFVPQNKIGEIGNSYFDAWITPSTYPGLEEMLTDSPLTKGYKILELCDPAKGERVVTEGQVHELKLKLCSVILATLASGKLNHSIDDLVDQVLGGAG